MMASSSCKIILATTALTALAMVLTVDATTYFTYPEANRIVNFWSRRSGSVVLYFGYKVGSINDLGSLSCRLDDSFLVQKRRTRPAVVIKQRERVDIVRDVPGERITIKLRRLTFKDLNKLFNCILSYKGLPYHSGSFRLKVYEPIKIINCLKFGTTNRDYDEVFELNEGATLMSTCIIYARPAPFLQCSLINKQDKVDNGAITKRVQTNFTKSSRTRLRFNNIRRTALRVRCVLDGGLQARRTLVQRNIFVDYKPTAPEKLQAAAITYKSIKCQWVAPKEPGVSKITYHLTASQLNGTKKHKGTVKATKRYVLQEYTFSNLQSNTYYRISVSAHNKVGQGAVKMATFKTSSKKTGLSMVKIIAFGAGGFVALIIIVIIVCCCCCKKKKKRAGKSDRRGRDKRDDNKKKRKSTKKSRGDSKGRKKNKTKVRQERPGDPTYEAKFAYQENQAAAPPPPPPAPSSGGRAGQSSGGRARQSTKKKRHKSKR